MVTLVAALVVLQSGGPTFHPKGPVIEFVMASGKTFAITTDPEHSPKTVRHIVDLVKSGFYNRQRIHRVEPWVVQWGAPASKTEPLMTKDKQGHLDLNPHVGDGGSGRNVPFEMAINIDFVRGMVGIASEGKQVGGDSQLFILKKDASRLTNSYAVVGKVTKGMDVVDRLAFGDRIVKARIEGAQQPAPHKTKPTHKHRAKKR